MTCHVLKGSLKIVLDFLFSGVLLKQDGYGEDEWGLPGSGI
jgi:hypothetical protein